MRQYKFCGTPPPLGFYVSIKFYFLIRFRPDPPARLWDIVSKSAIFFFWRLPLASILCCDQGNKLVKLPLELCLDNIITTEQLLLLLTVNRSSPCLQSLYLKSHTNFCEFVAGDIWENCLKTWWLSTFPFYGCSRE